MQAHPRFNTGRFHELDALRAFAMLLGIVLHACLFLLPFWPIQDPWARAMPVASNPYLYLVWAIHGFRMEVFFLLSGFFTAMLWQKRGLACLLRHRLRRIGLPLLAGILTLVPLTEWLLYPEAYARDWLAAWLLGWRESLSHLWFLWFLLIWVGLFAPAARAGLQFRHSALGWPLIPLSALCLYPMDSGFGADTSAKVFPDAVVLGFYGLFFLFGVFCYQRQFVLRRWWTVAVLPSALCFLGGIALLEAEGPVARGTGAVLQACYAWGMCLGLAGLFHMTASRERYWIRYLSDASYWLYLGHLPLVVWAQRQMAGWPISVHLKFLLICVSVTAVLLVLYHLGVRHTPVGTLLHGRRPRGTGPRLSPALPAAAPRP